LFEKGTPMRRIDETDLSRLLGQDALNVLMAEVGGTDWDVPAHSATKRGQALCELLGDGPATRLMAECGGCRVYVGYDYDRVLRTRQAEMLAMREGGKSIDEIAREYRYTGRYTSRNVREVLNHGREVRLNQPGLFDGFGDGMAT
jgi:hypothetical protein